MVNKTNVFQALETWKMETLQLLAEEASMEQAEELNKYYNPDLMDDCDIMERM